MSGLTTCADCGASIKQATDEPSTRLPCAACGSIRRNYVLTVDPIHINLSPFAFQWYAKNFYEAFTKMKGGPRFSPARLTLLAQAVELAAKSLHVHQGKRDADLRKIGHNLVKACDPATLSVYGITLTPNEMTELKTLSDLNQAKALEYFWFRSPHYSPELAGIMHAVTGRDSLPNESIVEELLIKLLAPTM